MTTLATPIFPFPRVSQGFKPGKNGHNGVDLAAPLGTPLHAMSDGTVAFTFNAADGGASGNAVAVNADDGRTQWSFSHMQDPSLLFRGNRVQIGDVLGVIGLTGQTNGPHLHLHVQVDGETIDPLDVIDPNFDPGDGASSSSGGGGTGAVVVVLGVGAVGYGLWRWLR